MAHNRFLLSATFVFATLLAIQSPALSQDAENGRSVSESNINPEPAASQEATPAQVEHAPAAEPSKATHKKAAHKKAHHKKKKKKAKHKAHKKSKHVQHAKKKKTHTVKHTPKHEKKSVVAAPMKEEESSKQVESMKQEEPAVESAPVQEAEPAKDMEPAQEAAPVKKMPKHAPAPAHKKTAAVKQAPKVAKVEKAPAASVARATNAGGEKDVTFTFCLGYDNCVPHRYEARVHGGGVEAKVLKEQGDQGWIDARIDPVMEADLAEMARTEPGGNMVRPLTREEKERIADHQGKTHVELVHAAKGGVANKEEVKQMLHNLKITSVDDLNTYDPRLGKNETAMQAATELASGR